MLNEKPVAGMFLVVEGHCFDHGPTSQIVQILDTEKAGFKALSLFDMKTLHPDAGPISYNWVMEGRATRDMHVRLARREEAEADLKAAIEKKTKLLEDLDRQSATTMQELKKAKSLLEDVRNGSELLHFASDQPALRPPND